MKKIKFGCSVATGYGGTSNLEEVIEQAVLAEKFGFDSVWLWDHFNTWSKEQEAVDVWVTLTAIAMKTSKVTLAPGVTDPLRRHPGVTAQSVATLDRVSNGRAMLGIGAGELVSLNPLGISWEKPVSRLREAIQVIKALWASSPENPANYEGKFYTLRNAFLQVKYIQKPHPPIYIGAMHAKTRMMAGEMTDGWFPTFGYTPEIYALWLNDVKKGAEKVGRSLKSIDCVARALTAVSRTYDDACKAIEIPGRLSLVLRPEILEKMGYKVTFPKVSFREFVLDPKEVEALTKSAETIPFEAVEKTTIFGTPDDCIKKIEEFIKAGSTHFVINNVGPDPRESLKLFGEKVIPYFREKVK